MADPKTHEELIEILEELDLSAADYVRENSIELYNEDKCSQLDGCFLWKNTPQGLKYWSNLDKKVKNYKQSNKED